MAKYKLTKKNYYDIESNQYYLSASAVKSYLKCPARFYAEITGNYERPKTPALYVGSYVDSYFEGKASFSQFCSENRNIIYKKQSKKAIADGELPQKYSDFVRADEMIERIKSDETFMEYMKGQKQKIVTGVIAGVPFKAKLDVYKKGERIVDLKTTKDFEYVYFPGQGKLNFADAYDYPLQLAIYQELVFQNTGEKLPTYLACVTKQDPPDIALIEIGQDKLDAELEFLKEILMKIDAVRQNIVEPERCECCEYCRYTKKLNKPVLLEDMFEGD